MGTDGFISTLSSEVKLFPNPAHESITLDDGNSINQQFHFEIFDILGKKIASGNSQEGQAINIENLTKGSYIITTQDDAGNKETNKILKK